MNIEDALMIVDSILPGRSLNNIQELLFRQTWEGKTYLAIAENSGYDASYVRDVGYKLWQTLSRAFGERVTKKNLQVVLRRYASKLVTSSPSPHGYEPNSIYETSQYGAGFSPSIGNLPNTFNPSNPQTPSLLVGDNWQGWAESNQGSSNINPIGQQVVNQPQRLRVSGKIDHSEPGNLNNIGQVYSTMAEEQINAYISTTHSQGNLEDRSLRQDWGSAIDTSDFIGREPELQQLEQWLIQDQARLIGTLGFGGVGKTALAAKIADRCQDEFDYLIWRSLRHAPALVDMLKDLVGFFSPQSRLDQSIPADRLLLLLFDCLRQHRCLLIFDQLETILRPADRHGFYLPGYEGYGDLFQQVGEINHQSCLLFTSREKPHQLMPTMMPTGNGEQSSQTIALMSLGGLELATAQQLPILARLKQLNPTNNPGLIANLASQYQTNPKMLKAVGRAIQELFDGAIEQFLAQDAIVFGEVRHLLMQQYDRLSGLEQRVMYWLAILPSPVTVEQLGQVMRPVTSHAELLEAITALRWRSLIAKQKHGFSLPRIIDKYVTNLVIEAAYAAITQQRDEFLVEFALYYPTSLTPAIEIDEIELPQSPQLPLAIIEPLLTKLTAQFGSTRSLGNKLSEILCRFSQSQQNPGYAQENILTLLRQLQLDRPGSDFAHLPIWQAYLQEILPQRSPLGMAQTGILASGLDDLADSSYSGRSIALGNNLQDLAKLVENPGSQLNCGNHSEYTTELMAIEFSPDGKVFACSNNDGSIKLRHSSNGDCLATLVGHTQPAFATTFSPDGQILASGSYDQTIRLWDIQTGECLKMLKIAGGTTTAQPDPIANPNTEPDIDRENRPELSDRPELDPQSAPSAQPTPG
ncbi:NB-ARC domain-containing protein [Thalassoporum mexicanum]|uniref:NB-ARC domain-containing protein n=1 Tax=Thalassoporum mexicanum TaxID=3457544 RepID=UPI0005A2692A|nr:NB-ARC domain-containing protein [Pseudanabaena sp. PCC 7367]